MLSNAFEKSRNKDHVNLPSSMAFFSWSVRDTSARSVEYRDQNPNWLGERILKFV